MAFLKKIAHELHYVKANDIGQIFLFIISLPCVLVYKIVLLFTKEEIWLVSEDRAEARDNGFCFFEYLSKEHPEIKSYYAISKKSSDYSKVKATGRTVRFGSIKHWILYFCSKHVITSQKNGRPSAAICYVLEVYGIIKSKTVFLQHGITINKGKWLFYENTKMRLFVCGAKPEYDFIREHFGYPEQNVEYLGFCRFDEYHSCSADKKQILLMPSWREWIATKTEYSNKYEDTGDFTKTEYYQKYQELINSPKLKAFLEENDLQLYFYPHRNMQKYIGHFSTSSDKIHIVSNKNSQIRELLTKSALMITDYSSVALDFAYMKKPVIYYQFDEKRFREAQYEEGYFSYRESGLGTVAETLDDVIRLLCESYNNNFEVSDEFVNAHSKFYPIFDDKNNERIFAAISKMQP